jgi:hypothetical protein
MDRRTLIAAGLAASAMAATGARAQDQQAPAAAGDAPAAGNAPGPAAAPAGQAPTSSLPPPGPERR